MRTRRKRVRLGRIYCDAVTFAGAIDAVVALARAGKGGYVVTPNVDHVCLAEEHPGLLSAYDGAALSLADGMPLVWMSRALGHPLPAKVSGSDLVVPLLERAAQERLPAFFLGAAPGVADEAARRLTARIPTLEVCGTFAPPLGFEEDPALLEETFARVEGAKPALVLIALGCPKQEVFMRAHSERLAPAVCLGLGASLDFIAGKVKRAPAWMSNAGLEWTWRLAQEPRRMYERYFVRDRVIGRIFLEMLRLPHEERAYFVG